MKRIFSFLLLAGFCLSLAGCGGGSGASEDKPLTISINCYNGNYVEATTQIIQQEGLLEKYLPENVTVEYTGLVSGPEIRDAMLAGDIQIAGMSLMSFQTGLENDLPLTLISFCGSTPINLYSNKSEITSLEDFTGSEQITVTNRATNLHAAYLAQCKEMGLDITKYDAMLIAAPNTEALALLSDGNTVSGSILSFPTYVSAERMPDVHLICDMSDAISKYSVGSAYVTTSEFYHEHPEIVEAFRKAQDDALTLFAEEPDRMAEILAELYDVDTAVVLEAIEEVPPTKSLTGYDNLAALLYEVGILKQAPIPFAELPNYQDIADLGG